MLGSVPGPFRMSSRSWPFVIGGVALLIAIAMLLARTDDSETATVEPTPAPRPETPLPTTPRPERRARAPEPPARPERLEATLRAIASHGPFRHRQDGVVFENRERRLPRRASGYYHEYTVETPGSRDRGARRVITGGDPAAECFYTEDHYASFQPIDCAPAPRR